MGAHDQLNFQEGRCEEKWEEQLTVACILHWLQR